MGSDTLWSASISCRHGYEKRQYIDQSRNIVQRDRRGVYEALTDHTTTATLLEDLLQFLSDDVIPRS